MVNIVGGFKFGECGHGIPMLPKASSEVWLLSSILISHKMNGRHLEEVRDRDYLKEELKKRISSENLNDFNFAFPDISDNISSYQRFKHDLDSVLKKLDLDTSILHLNYF
ncbi:MAG: hypothetical protein LBI42_08120 [Chitinispirillales bacterium]|jgi:hypothetical protein|nr:hypothetical protein [Chitinispirillales bacterium]